MNSEQRNVLRAWDELIGVYGNGAARLFGSKMGSFPGGAYAWGNGRIWINGTKFGRSGFSIHGGYSPGSAGCIDVVKNISIVINNLQNLSSRSGHFSIPLKVNY